MFTISCSKLASASVPWGGPRGSPSLIVGITSHMVGVGRAFSVSGHREGVHRVGTSRATRVGVSEQAVPGE